VTNESGWEDLGTILSRVMQKVRVDANNFGTAAMIPWLEDKSPLVIVDG
jgi:hypothetical protein